MFFSRPAGCSPQRHYRHSTSLSTQVSDCKHIRHRSELIGSSGSLSPAGGKKKTTPFFVLFLQFNKITYSDSVAAKWSIVKRSLNHLMVYILHGEADENAQKPVELWSLFWWLDRVCLPGRISELLP